MMSLCVNCLFIIPWVSTLLAASLTMAFVTSPTLTPPFGVQNARCPQLYSTAAPPVVDLGSKYFQLQEMEDGESATTEMFLRPGGQIDFFESDGPISKSCEGDWMQDGEDFTMIITRLFEAGHEERHDTDMGEFSFEVERTFKGRVTNVGIANAVEGTIHDMDDLFGDRKIGFFQMIDTTEERLKYHGVHDQSVTPSVTKAADEAPEVKVRSEAPEAKSDPFADIDVGGSKAVNGIDVSTPLAKPDFPNPFEKKKTLPTNGQTVDSPVEAIGVADSFAKKVIDSLESNGEQKKNVSNSVEKPVISTPPAEPTAASGHVDASKTEQENESNGFKEPTLSNGHSASAKQEKISKHFFGNYLDQLEKNALREPKIAGGHIIDEETRLEQSDFPIAPDDLIELAKNVLRVSCGLDDESVLADDFEFYAATYGPVTKEQFLGTHMSGEIGRAFPDFDNQYYNFHVDPFEFNRVWYHIRPKATHTGDLKQVKATGKKVQLPPQAQSLVFNEEGKVSAMTVGYVMDNRVGNTKGFGGTYGLLAGIGQG